MVIYVKKKKQNDRTLSTYVAALGIQSRSTQKLFQCVINNIKAFGGMDVENASRYDEDHIYNILQQWVIWNNKRGITASKYDVLP